MSSILCGFNDVEDRIENISGWFSRKAEVTVVAMDSGGSTPRFTMILNKIPKYSRVHDAIKDKKERPKIVFSLLLDFIADRFTNLANDVRKFKPGMVVFSNGFLRDSMGEKLAKMGIPCKLVKESERTDLILGKSLASKWATQRKDKLLGVATKSNKDPIVHEMLSVCSKSVVESTQLTDQNTALMWAVVNNNPVLVRALLKKVSMNRRQSSRSSIVNGTTLLHKAVQLRDVNFEIVEMILNATPIELRCIRAGIYKKTALDDLVGISPWFYNHTPESEFARAINLIANGCYLHEIMSLTPDTQGYRKMIVPYKRHCRNEIQENILNHCATTLFLNEQEEFGEVIYNCEDAVLKSCKWLATTFASHKNHIDHDHARANSKLHQQHRERMKDIGVPRHLIRGPVAQDRELESETYEPTLGNIMTQWNPRDHNPY
eukprot:TRINITY_DN93540_c0_g1_i1.p1 TRINITY_DN93540_c0_g1~~TRINITY_DN93540_c0_g1_i1.p1  ORF type:complete len:433 (-),score=104.80 TRINITY_DN93540_c0_g1_i1:72-1370(-)